MKPNWFTRLIQESLKILDPSSKRSTRLTQEPRILQGRPEVIQKLFSLVEAHPKDVVTTEKEFLGASGGSVDSGIPA